MVDVKRYWQESPVMIGCILLIIASLSYASFGSLVRMEHMWSSKEEYGYAYMIPVIVAYFIWQNKSKLEVIEYEVSWIGGALVLFGLFVMMMGVLSATHSITQYGYILTLVSVIYQFVGNKAFKILMPSLLMLFLIVPLPAFFFNNLSSSLQLISSEIGVWVIRSFGISVYLEGNVIDLGAFQLQVVEACSGLRYLFPLFSLSVIAVFMFKVELWKKIIVVLSSIPITVLMNSFRIGVIGVLVEYGGIEQAEGFLHDFEGWFVFMACVSLLLIEMWLLVSIGANKQRLSDAFAFEMPELTPSDVEFTQRKVSWKYFATTVCIVVAGIVLGSLDERDEIIPQRTDYLAYPLQHGEWYGNRTTIEKIYLDELKLDDYFIADFSRDNGDGVNFYMAYYESQRSGAAAHSPKSCIPGGGWRIKSHTVIDIAGTSKYTNRLLIRKGDYGQLVYYWFDQRGRNITNEYMVKWYLFWDSLTLGRTDGALIRLTTSLKPGEDVVNADNRLIEFAQLIQPALHDYIPE